MVPPMLEISAIWPNASACGSAKAGVAIKAPAVAIPAAEAVTFNAMCENITWIPSYNSCRPGDDSFYDSGLAKYGGNKPDIAGQQSKAEEPRCPGMRRGGRGCRDRNSLSASIFGCPGLGVVCTAGGAESGYRPSAALAEFIRIRDLTCRFPGADHPAELPTSTTPSPIRWDSPTPRT
jgi:hypothetical protein